MRSAKSNYTFSKAPTVSIPRSVFKRDRTYKTTLDVDYIYPIYLDEVLPGDTFKVKLTAFARLATPVVPIMDNLYMDFFFFFVPNRLVWKNWVRFCGEQDNPNDSTDYLVPQFTNGDSAFALGSIADYFGLPIQVPNISVSALPFRGYQLIYNQFFRDENLQMSVPIPDGDGPDPTTVVWDDGQSHLLYVLRKRGKRKDYFTSCMRAPQKGPGVELPISGMAPIVNWEDEAPEYKDHLLNPWVYDNLGNKLSAGALTMRSSGHLGVSGSGTSSSSACLALGADLGATASVTINTMRMAFQAQRYLEKCARSGTRYFEVLVSHFAVRSPDSRLQRPEYLGGGTIPVNIHTVAQTSSTDDTSPQGNLAAIGVAATNQGIGFSKSFVEHGYVFGLVNVRADLTYQQGIDRHWSRRTLFDFYWPSFAHLGEQAVLNKEIYAQGSEALDDDANVIDDKVFGYQERWAEYRYGINKITGKLRGGLNGSLDVWHLSQYFATLPTLSSSFITEAVPISRVIAVQDEPAFIFDSLISCQCVRPMPVYSIPGLIDHF